MFGVEKLPEAMSENGTSELDFVGMSEELSVAGGATKEARMINAREIYMETIVSSVVRI